MQDEFYVVIKLAKGFRYRYVFEVDGREELDMNDPNRGPNHEGRVTNYVEVAGDESMTMGDFMKQMAAMQDAAQDGPMLSKQVSYFANENKITDEIKEMTGYTSMM